VLFPDAVLGRAIHDREGFTTFSGIKVFAIMGKGTVGKRDKSIGMSDDSGNWKPAP
jgi:hypothetical protein